MRNDTWIGKKGFRYYYYRFRDSEYYSVAIIGLTIIGCILLVFNIIIPELNQWFSIRDEVAATQQKIDTITQNISFINGLDRNKLNSQLQTVTSALPSNKDFGFMISALNSAAESSGVSLNDYAFQVGDLSTKGQKGAPLNGLSSIGITITVNGDINSIKRFIATLEKTAPVSEVISINGSGQNVSLSIQFYQKPFATVSFAPDTPLQPISVDKTQLLNNISKWGNVTQTQNTPTEESSGSAVPLF